ncbi:hypothetical protein [Novosphingobium humi]|uniref:Pectate lyase superfamily protein n=1 Tax=Novosphingobium humi TaxID=2282397 RepID=A0ABY7U046_9SPHN|nr:hypothetical protein [Novosphingobium humi]WCT78868.1 hypothetical protein PQ457_07900 [Novosphingobium humi]
MTGLPETTTPAQAAAAMMDYITYLNASRAEWSAAMRGSATGGPNGDGYFPLTMFDGSTILVPSVAKLMAVIAAMPDLNSQIEDLPAGGAGDLGADFELVGRKGAGQPPKRFAPALFAQGRTRDLATVSALLGDELLPCLTSAGGGQDRRFALSTLGNFLSGGVINPKLPPYNCKGDCCEISDAVSTAGSAVITSASGLFTPADVGKLVYLTNAGPSGSVLATTVQSYQNPHQVTLAAAASVSRSNGMLWGTDDSAGLAAALAASAPRGAVDFGGVVMLPPGWYLTGPQVYQSRAALVGAAQGRICALVRKPDGTTNPLLANKTYASPAAMRTDDFPIIDGIGLHGARYYQSGPASECFYWNAGIGSTVLTQIDPFIRFTNIEVWEASSTAFRLRGRGAGQVNNINLTGGWGEGFLYDSYDTTINGVQTQNFLNAGIHIGAGGANSTFTGLKASYNGTGSTTANASQERCCNMLVEGQGCTFDGALFQESCGSNLVIKGNNHSFMGMQFQDTGDTWPVGGNGSGGGLLPFRADIVLSGGACVDNLIIDAKGFGSVHAECYATHALYLVGYPTRNRGSIWTAPAARSYYSGGTAPNGSTIPGGTGVYAPGAIGNDSSGSRANNSPLTIDGVSI